MRSHLCVCVCVRETQVEGVGRGVLLFTPAVLGSVVTKENTGISEHRVNTMTEPIFYVQETSGLMCFKRHGWTTANRLIIDDLKCPYICLQKSTSLCCLTDESLLQTAAVLFKGRQKQSLGRW